MTAAESARSGRSRWRGWTDPTLLLRPLGTPVPMETPETNRPPLGFLVDWQVEQAVADGELGIEPFNLAQLQQGAYELRLDNRFRAFDEQVEVIDPLDEDSASMHEITVEPGKCLILHPGQFMLGSSIERWTFKPNMLGLLNGKSSLGRRGLSVHITAGVFDQGFEGTVTLEFSNAAPVPIRLWPGMFIAQMFFVRTETVRRPYGHPDTKNHYQGQDGPQMGAAVRIIPPTDVSQPAP